MQLFHAIILGIVEGITEFLPISSTAHLLLTERLLGLPSTELLKTFTIAIQLGAILAVLLLYIQRLSLVKEVWLKIVVAFIPTGLIGFFFYRSVRAFLSGDDSIILWALGIGGLIIVLFEFFSKDTVGPHDTIKELHTFSYGKVFLVGLAQSLALIPGVSRAAATIIAGRALGLSRQAIVEFSFLLAIPTMGMAVLYDMYKQAPMFNWEQVDFFIVGFVAAFISAYISVRWLLSFIKKHNFIIFGFYRIAIALLFIPLFL